MNADQRTITQIVASAASEGRKQALILHLGELTLKGLSSDGIRDRLAKYADHLAGIKSTDPVLDEVYEDDEAANLKAWVAKHVTLADDPSDAELTDKGKAACEALGKEPEGAIDIPDIFDPDPRMSRHTLFGSAIIGAAMLVRHEVLNPQFNEGGGVSDGNYFWEHFDTLVHCIMCAEANLINRVIEDGGHKDLLDGILGRATDEFMEGAD